MITLSPADYALVAIIFLAVVFRIIGDVRDVAAARSAKRIMMTIVKRKFSPRLTIVMPLSSAENAKQTLSHLSESDLPLFVIIAADSKAHKAELSSLRYFVRKNSMKRVVITTKKKTVTEIAAEYAKSGLIVVLPDSVRLSDSFYYDAVLPFADKTVDRLRLPSSVRANSTLRSGIEVLFTAWRQYIRLNGLGRRKREHVGELVEGVVVRSKFVRKLGTQKLSIATARKSAYSVASRPTYKSTWLVLQKSSGLSDAAAVLVVASIAALLVLGSYDTSFILGIFALVYGVFVWWALDRMTISFVDRVSVLLLAPLFSLIATSLIIVRSLKAIFGPFAHSN